MKRRFVAVLAVAACIAAPALARAEADREAAPPPAAADTGLDLRVDRDGFRIGGRLLGPWGPYGAWLSGALRGRGLTLGGGLETPRRNWDFRLDTDLDLRTSPPGGWPQRL